MYIFFFSEGNLFSSWLLSRFLFFFDFLLMENLILRVVSFVFVFLMGHWTLECELRIMHKHKGVWLCSLSFKGVMFCSVKHLHFCWILLGFEIWFYSLLGWVHFGLKLSHVLPTIANSLFQSLHAQHSLSCHQAVLSP